MFHSVYKQRAFKENIIGVPRKTTKLLYWGTGHKKRAQTLISMSYQTN